MTNEQCVQEFLKCRDNIEYFLATYCFTIKTLYDENGKPIRELYPVPLHWLFIKDMFDLMDGNDNVILLKSRQMYASTLGMARYLHKLLFARNFQAKVITKDSKLCYNKTDESLFGRIETMHRHLPKFLQQDLHFVQHPDIKVVNKSNGNALLGSATTSDSARGGTYEETWLDESAFYGNMSEDLYSAVIAGSGRILLNSTPNGKNFFYRVWKDAEIGKNGFKWMKIHWTLHPEYDEAWYHKKTASLTESKRLREYEMSFEGSIEGKVWSFDRNIHVKNLDVNDLKKYQLMIGADYGFRDATSFKFVFYDRVKDVGYIVGEYHATQKTVETIVKEVIVYLHQLFGIPTVEAEQLMNSAYGYGDPAGNQKREGSGKSVIDEYRKFGLNFYTKKKTNVILGINEVERRLTWTPEPKLVVDSKCWRTIDELTMCHWATDAYDNVRNTATEKYAHDEYSHGADAVRYWCENMPVKTMHDNSEIEVVDYLADEELFSVPFKS